MNEYTPPTIERIREELPELTKEIRKRASILGAETIAGQLNSWKFSDELADLFDRWLAEVKAEAVIELVARIEAAVILLGDDDITPTGRRMISKVLNPYREGEGSGNDASQSLVESGNLLNGEEQ